MKKIVSLIFILSFTIFGLFAAEPKAGLELGIGSGYVFYGDKATKDMVSDMNGSDFSRFIISSDVGFFIPMADIVYFTTSAEMMSDLFWKGDQNCYFFDYAFNAGLRMYPGLGGVAFGVAYSLGRRTSVIDLDDIGSKTVSTSWGNGFRFDVEYDIRYGKEGLSPVIGAYWRHMPRGDSFSDNSLSVFLRLLFRWVSTTGISLKPEALFLPVSFE